MANHIGKYFSSVQRSDMPNDQFDCYIINVLETTLDTFHQADEKYNCHFCSDQFPGWEKARNHLVVKHRQILKDKLVEEQKSGKGLPESPHCIKRNSSNANDTDTDTTSIIPTLKRKRKSRKSKKLLHCICSRSFPDKRQMFRHNMSNHPEKFFLSVKSELLTLHQFQICVAKMLSKTVDKLETVDSRYQCDLCSKLLSDRQCAKNHFVRKHCSNLKEKLVEAQKSGKGLCDTDGTKTTLKREGRKLKNLKLNCSACSRSFPNKQQIFQHNMSNHPEKFFLSVKSELLTPHQFQVCVANMLSITVDELEKLNSKYQCNFCVKSLSTKQGAKNHLARKHRSNLKKKLVELQKSNSVVIRMNRSGMIKIVGNWNGKRGGSDYICNICDKKFTRRFKVTQHQRYSHPEKLFEMLNHVSSSSSSENNELFKTCVHYVLEKQRISAFSKEEDDQVKCNMCSKMLSSVYNAKSHLISKHRSVLAEKLEEVQKSGKSLREIGKELELLRRKAAKLFKRNLAEETESESD